jgi:hypothetical protein
VIWNTLVDEMMPFPKVYELLKATIKKRTNYRGSDPTVYWRYSDNLQPILHDGSNDVKSLIDQLLTDRDMRDCVGLKTRGKSV